MEADHEDEDTLSVDEHGSFVQVLQSFLKVVKGRFQTLCTTFIKQKNFEKLQELTGHVECIETFVDGSTTILRKDAQQTATTLLNFFAEYTELEDAVVNLQGWQMEILPREKLSSTSDDTMGQVFQKLLQVWDAGWQEQKQKLLNEEDYTALSNLKAMKEKLDTWASREAPPTGQEVPSSSS